MTQLLRVAPWPTSLKVVSLLGSAALCAAAYFAYRVIPVPTGFTHWFGIGVAALPLAVLLGALLSVVRGYAIDDRCLYVQRLVRTTEIPLRDLWRAWLDPAVCRGSVRVFGNGGLFSFTGWFYSKRLGRYRMFATDLRRAVVLQFSDRVAVVSPAVPDEFLVQLRHHVPGLRVGAPDCERSQRGNPGAT